MKSIFGFGNDVFPYCVELSIHISIAVEKQMMAHHLVKGSLVLVYTVLGHFFKLDQ